MRALTLRPWTVPLAVDCVLIVTHAAIAPKKADHMCARKCRPLLLLCLLLLLLLLLVLPVSSLLPRLMYRCL
jgi:hypothetical protein